MSTLVPYVIEQSGRGERSFDIYSRLLKDRIVFVTGTIDDATANLVCAQILHLEHEDPAADIELYLNSPGGSVTAGLAIYDTMQYVAPAVATLCMGTAASIAAVLLAAGTAGKRAALPNARVMIHQPWGDAGRAQAADLEILAKEFARSRDQINEILAVHTGRGVDLIRQDTDRDHYMGAEEAIEYGMIDSIYARRPGKTSPNGYAA